MTTAITLVLLAILLSILTLSILIIRKLYQNEKIQLTRYIYICRSLQDVETKILEALKKEGRSQLRTSMLECLEEAKQQYETIINTKGAKK